MYTNYNKMGTTPEEELDHTEVEEMDEGVNEAIEETEPETPDILLGNVTGCTKLNVRQEPVANGMIIGTLPVSSEVMIDESESTEDFYKVCTASGMEGYCVKRFITIQ